MKDAKVITAKTSRFRVTYRTRELEQEKKIHQYFIFYLLYQTTAIKIIYNSFQRM